MTSDDKGLYKWLTNIVRIFCRSYMYIWLIDLQDKFGFSFVSGVPATPEATEELSTRIGFIRETQCTSSLAKIVDPGLSGCVDGKFWDFTADLAKGDTAYTNLALGAHTDNTYYVCRSIVIFTPKY